MPPNPRGPKASATFTERSCAFDRQVQGSIAHDVVRQPPPTEGRQARRVIDEGLAWLGLRASAHNRAGPKHEPEIDYLILERRR